MVQNESKSYKQQQKVFSGGFAAEGNSGVHLLSARCTVNDFSLYAVKVHTAQMLLV